MKEYLIFLFMIFFALGCKEDSPIEPKPGTLTLKVEEASCTEAWLKATITETRSMVALLRDGHRISVLNLQTPDSLLLDEGLLPKRTYTYQLQKLGSDSSIVETSTSVQLTTMDTTSHNWSFSFDTLGVTSSTLYDVAIINDTLAYAVGEVYLRDSTGQLEETFYNLAKWNGHTWTMMRLRSNCRFYFPNCGPETLLISPGKSIFAFGPNDIWVTAGGVHHFDGVRWTEKRAIVEMFDAVKMWGGSGNNLWFVGYNGLIIHYDGAIWERVESGTTVMLNDVWGGSNPLVGQNVVLVAASYKFEPGEKRLVRINANGLVDILPWPMQDRRLHSVWFDVRSRVYTSGGGVFQYMGAGLWNEQPIPLFFTDRIRGTSANSLVVVGDFGIAAHYNGLSWHHFPEVRIAGNYESVAVRDNLMIAVGWIGNRAVAMHGTRQ